MRGIQSFLAKLPTKVTALYYLVLRTKLTLATLGYETQIALLLLSKVATVSPSVVYCNSLDYLG
jgi:hypothetical protein